MDIIEETTEQPRDVVTLLGREIKLTAPSSLATCREVFIAAGHNYQRAVAACLALCWREARHQRRKKSKGLKRPEITYQSCDYNPLRYGGEFSDALEAQGVDWGEIQAAGLVAFVLISKQLPDADDEDAASGN